MFAHFHDYAKKLRPVLDSAFTSHLVDLLGDAKSLGSVEESKPLTGGKKIRGSLVCLIATTLGGALEDALPRAVAIELIQTATLIHDDYVDQHRSRRDQAAVWTLDGARRAVLLGDIIFASAIRMMSELGRIDGLIVSRAIAEVSRGAYREPLNPQSLLAEIETGRVNGALYEKIIYLKTGVLFGAACQLGAVAAKADDKLQRMWSRYGLKIGEAYQITDDLHEFEQCLLKRTVTGNEMAGLAPALLFFVKQSRPRILKVLRQEVSDLKGELLLHFQTAAELMHEEKEKRLRLALAEIEGFSPDNDLGRLTRKTPRDLIKMFDETRSLSDSGMNLQRER